jgi:UDPglucose 6-dehydrogenase
MNISVIGLGKLGLCLSVCYSWRGYNVLGIDLNEDIVNSVNRRKAPWYEPDLQDYMNSCQTENLRATTDIF